MKPTKSARPKFLVLPAILAAALALGACSQNGAPQSSTPAAAASAQQATASNAAAAKELKLYREMLAQHSDTLAAPIGKDIVRKYPGTPAATEVQKTLPQVETKAKASATHERLANLWYYQTANVDGMQSTASIYSSQPTGARQVRLVLRRHVKWGQSAYLFGPDGSKGFVCKNLCNVVMHFDGKREVWKAFLPKAGKEPAMFIKNYKRFIAALQKAKVIDMDVTTQDHGKETLKFEVGGYDAAKFKPLPKT